LKYHLKTRKTITMANTTAKKAKKVANDFKITKVVDRVIEGAKDVNDYMLDNSDDFIKETVTRGEQWQDVAAKAVKGGLKLSANTQDIVFDTLETLKDQVQDSRTRLRSLFSKN
jgi:methionyl-tRNA synthetase